MKKANDIDPKIALRMLKTGRKSARMREFAKSIEQITEAIRLKNASKEPFPHIRWVDCEEDADAWLREDEAGLLSRRGEDGRITIWLPDWAQEFFCGLFAHHLHKFPDGSVPEKYASVNLTKVKFLCAWGGRGSGKSRAFALMIVIAVGWLGWRVACCREVMNTIADSSKAEIEAEITRYGLDHMFVIQEKYIKGSDGARIIFRGLLRNVQGIKSLSDVDMAYVDEAENVSARSWRVMVPSIRKGTSRVVCAFNPFRDIDPTYKTWVSECKWPEFEKGLQWTIIRKVNYDLNPWFHQTSLLQEAAVMKREDPDEFDHVYMGNPVGASALAIIKPRWIQDCFDLHLLLTGTIEYGRDMQPVGGFDPGGTEKGDPSAVAFQLQSVLCHLDERRFEDPLLATQWTYAKALEFESERVHYDKGGVGLGSKGKVRELNAKRESEGHQAITFSGWDAGGEVVGGRDTYSPRRKMVDQFRDWKAQHWGLLGDRFRHGYLCRKYFTDYIRGKAPYFDDLREEERWKLIEEHREGAFEYMADNMGDRLREIISIDTMNISPALLVKLKGELSTPTWIPADGGKRAVISKKELAKKGIPSTNLADAVVLAFTRSARSVHDEAA